MKILCVCMPLHSATLDTMLRSLVIGQLGHFGDPQAIEEARKRFKDHVTAVKTIPADLKSAIFSTCLAHGDKSTFDQFINVIVNQQCGCILFNAHHSLFIQMHDRTDSNEEKVRIYHCLGKGNSDALTRKALDFCLCVSV